jgi:hypothetical protein
VGTENEGEWRRQFLILLEEELIPEFCSLPSRQCHSEGFVRESIKVSDIDARDFVRAWRGGLINRADKPGLYRSPRSAASEQFFWEGPRKQCPRSFTLSIEPIITIAALARLCLDYGWPASLLGTQSSDWAFDIVAFGECNQGERLLGEVKKTTGEVDLLIKYMHEFGRDLSLAAPTQPKALNSYKKVVSLQRSAASLFWAVGPDGYGSVFRIRRCSTALELAPVEESELAFAPNG